MDLGQERSSWISQGNNIDAIGFERHLMNNNTYSIPVFATYLV